ncbi:MAG: DnaJ domain-containing protein [Alphaproteobacteria bacterium]|nr:DnaJ domain-containing protein [Alphaproteobacteria bacterium]MCB9692557.1 DnaJ domain-containing protein [Alphaproteobacteria bacterium]
MTRDFYNVLGIPRNATQDDVKKAYRSLARRWHPDKNPGDEAAADRFKDITEAYRTLSDPDKRRRYDRLGPLYREDGRPPRPEDVNEVVTSFFGGMFRRRSNERGEDLRYTVSLTLEEVAKGVDKPIVVPRKIRCNVCDGLGVTPEARVDCEVCGGSGKAKGTRLFRSNCYHCEGRGFTASSACTKCDGDGRVSLEDTLTVKVPPGVAAGQKLKLAGKGDASRGDGPDGDLYVVVSVADHPLFRRRGEDLLVDLPLRFDELILGADVKVPTLEGVTTIRIPAGSEPGKVLRLAGRGLPRVSSAGRGDLHLQLQLELPAGIEPLQRRAIEALRDTLPPQAHPRRAAFDRALEERE